MTQTWDEIRGSDVIDTRDITDRIEDIGTDLEGLDETSADDAAEVAELREELDVLTAIVEECDEYFGDSFRDGVTLVRDDYFEEYAEQLADDIGAIDKDAGWPLTYIDWAAAAAALQQDYTSIDIDGTTYWGR